MIQRLVWWLNILLVSLTLLALLSPEISPFTLWPVAFAGLAFPSLVIVNVLFLLWWLFQLDRRLLLSLLALFLCMPHISEFVRFNEPPVKDEALEELVMVNYNLLGGSRLHSEDDAIFQENLSRFGDCVLQDVALIAMEETPAYYKVREAMSREMNARGIKYHYYPPGVHVSLHSKYPLLNKKLRKKYNDLNAIVSAQIVVPTGDTLQVYAVHLQSNSVRLEARRVLSDATQGKREAYWKIRNVAANYRAAARKRTEQVNYLTDIIAESPYPVLVLGDLNDTPMSFAIGQLKDAGLSDSFSESGTGVGITYPGTIPGLRIDYALASDELKWLHSEVLDCGFSDHKPVRATLGMKP